MHFLIKFKALLMQGFEFYGQEGWGVADKGLNL